jgi:hypothetical protein
MPIKIITSADKSLYGFSKSEIEIPKLQSTLERLKKANTGEKSEIN